MRTDLVRWLICGLSGATACLAAVLLIARPPFDPRFLLFPAFGFLWAIVAGAMARGIRCYPLPLVMLVGPIVGGVGNHFLPPLLLPWLHGQPWPLASMYPNSMAMGALAGFAGAPAGLMLWRAEERDGRRSYAVPGLAVAVLVLLLWPSWSPLFQGARELALASSCLSDLKMLGLATLMYAQDYDERFPPAATTNDLAGVDYSKIPEAKRRGGPRACQSVFGGGLIWPYAKNRCLFICPSDPWNHDVFGDAIPDRFIKVGLSYTWNAPVAGRALKSVPPDTWLFHDREPWHHKGWNVAFADGNGKWCAAIPPPHPVPRRP